MSRQTRRLNLQRTLEAIPGIRKVYFQPPASIHLEYPCIVYSYTGDEVLHANNRPYIVRDDYDALLITKDPLPDETMDRMLDIPYTSFDRHFVEDNLHHFSYSLNVIERISNG